MDLSKKRCGECGARAYVRQKVDHRWNKPWKDFPAVFLTKNLELWSCSSCGAYAMTADDITNIDNAIEESIRCQTSQFLEIIHNKSGLNYEAMAERLGYSNAYLSSLKNRNKTPAFKLWNQLKSIAISPKTEMAKLDPKYDIIKNNLLLRA